MDAPPTPDEPGRDDLGDARVRDLLSALGAQTDDPLPPGIPDDVADRITVALRAESAARELAGRDLLTTLPAPGPMPDDVTDRITAALRTEQPSLTEGTRETPDGGSVTPFLPRRRPRRGWTTALTAAAAVAAVAVVGTVVVRTMSPDRSSEGAAARIHVQVSGATYLQDRLGLQARNLLMAPRATLTGSGTASGPLATTSGIRACLAGLGVTDPTAVSVDLASYEGAPAAILVVTGAGTTTVYAVGRDCSASAAHVLEGGVAVP